MGQTIHDLRLLLGYLLEGVLPRVVEAHDAYDRRKATSRRHYNALDLAYNCLRPVVCLKPLHLLKRDKSQSSL